VLIPSLVFGYIQERTNNLAAPIALHSTYNAGFFLLLG
jgi:membrane protease YdiL (CAAX protease family)